MLDVTYMYQMISKCWILCRVSRQPKYIVTDRLKLLLRLRTSLTVYVAGIAVWFLVYDHF